MGEATELLSRSRIAAIVQSPERADLIARALAAAQGGLEVLALPLSIPFVAEIAAEIADEANVTVAISDVVSTDQINLALAAGVELVFSPIFDYELIEAGRARGVDVLCSVTTPNELFSASRGLTEPLIVTPAAGLGGPGYLAMLSRCFPATQLVAMGGVGSDTAPQYIEAGALAVVVDTGLFPKDLDPEANAVISVRAEALVELCQSVGLSDLMT